MTRLGYIFFLQATLFLSTCNLFPEEEPGKPASLSDEAVERLFEVALAAETEPTAISLENILGPPGTVYTEAVPNPHRRDQTDTLRTLHYDGLELQLYETHPPAETGDPMRSFLIQIVVDEPGHPTPADLEVGASQEAVLERLGLPLTQEIDRWQYALNEAETIMLEVTFSEEEEVERLAWQFYLD